MSLNTYYCRLWILTTVRILTVVDVVVDSNVRNLWRLWNRYLWSKRRHLILSEFYNVFWVDIFEVEVFGVNVFESYSFQNSTISRIAVRILRSTCPVKYIVLLSEFYEVFVCRDDVFEFLQFWEEGKVIKKASRCFWLLTILRAKGEWWRGRADVVEFFCYGYP